MIRGWWLWLGLVCISPAHADFGVLGAAPVLHAPADSERILTVNTRLLLSLNPTTEEALHNGIPLEIVIDTKLLRQRWWWTNKVIADWTLRRRLSFHALSRQYLVSGLALFQPSESFASLDLALAHAGNLTRLNVPISSKKEIHPDDRHLLQIRARLDIEALPSVMRPLAYASPSWRLNSGWSSWPVQQ